MKNAKLFARMPADAAPSSPCFIIAEDPFPAEQAGQVARCFHDG